MPITVSTKCPSCAGEVEFEQGTNAVHCGFCGSDHLVTGRGRVLSYYVPEKVPVWEALARAREALAGAGIPDAKTRDATLFFVPFYHLIGQALHWEAKEDAERKKSWSTSGVSVTMTSSDTEDGAGFGQSGMGSLLMEGLGGNLLKALKGDGVPNLVRKTFEPRSAYISRSAPALDIPELKVPSLGVRADVLKLALFEKAAVTARGQVVPVKASLPDYEARGYAPSGSEEAVARTVFGKVRSVIYFPFWLVESGGAPGGPGSFTVVDAVSGEVANPLAPAEILDKLVARDGIRFDVAGLRPLKCPDCGNGLPVKPRDAVFVCGTCRKAWMVSGDGFEGIPCSIAAPQKKGSGEPVYFPLWVVTARLSTPDLTVENKYDLGRLMPGLRVPTEEDKALPLRFFVPALRIGSQLALSRLATNFTRFQPTWEKDIPYSISAKGCHITQDDALSLIPLILFAMAPKDNIHKVRFALEAKVEPSGVELVLIPFYKGRGDYVDSILGQSLQAAAVKD
ncbi:MAG: hypothetical protein HZC51_13190 [Nitrospirae bacterium]|nr:hypothetical protein [Nitrospirota bacterium]